MIKNVGRHFLNALVLPSAAPMQQNVLNGYEAAQAESDKHYKTALCNGH
jgi:hypothetical protein